MHEDRRTFGDDRPLPPNICETYLGDDSDAKAARWVFLTESDPEELAGRLIAIEEHLTLLVGRLAGSHPSVYSDLERFLQSFSDPTAVAAYHKFPRQSWLRRGFGREVVDMHSLIALLSR